MVGWIRQLHHDALAATKYALYVYNHAVRLKESDLINVFLIFEFNMTLSLVAMRKTFCLCVVVSDICFQY